MRKESSGLRGQKRQLCTISKRREGYLMLSGEGAGGNIGFIKLDTDADHVME